MGFIYNKVDSERVSPTDLCSWAEAGFAPQQVTEYSQAPQPLHRKPSPLEQLLLFWSHGLFLVCMYVSKNLQQRWRLWLVSGHHQEAGEFLVLWFWPRKDGGPNVSSPLPPPVETEENEMTYHKAVLNCLYHSIQKCEPYQLRKKPRVYSYSIFLNFSSCQLAKVVQSIEIESEREHL